MTADNYQQQLSRHIENVRRFRNRLDGIGGVTTNTNIFSRVASATVGALKQPKLQAGSSDQGIIC